MRIAEIAPVWVSVPPPSYGGIELMVSLIADGLVDRGHDVTLFASGGSKTKGKLVTPLEETPDLADMGLSVTDDIIHTLTSYLQASDFDVIHDHSGFGPAFGALLNGRPPVVRTLHGPWSDEARRFHAALADRVHLVAISQSQAGFNDELRYEGVVYNGLDIDAYPYREEKEDFLLFLGRCNPEKGPEVAVDVAKRAGKHLKMVVKRSEPAEVQYWERMVEPRLTGDEEIVLDVSHDEKVDLLSRAQGTLCTIQWPEPFGLVMTESMACGTPVIVPPMGAAPELVVDGETGFLREDVDEMVACVARLGEISPAACRARVADNFTAEVMVRGYEKIFERVVGGG
ncbi:MAG TPA: glycosyltransferase family 4 protein [Acidimicrobiales bacterium]|nr:glycosyltransferase family 4 protein [Acidimicrobiales bacterium]